MELAVGKDLSEKLGGSSHYIMDATSNEENNHEAWLVAGI